MIHEKLDVNEYANHKCIHHNLKNNQNLLVALAWVAPSERRIFTLYPETLFVETMKATTSHHGWL